MSPQANVDVNAGLYWLLNIIALVVIVLFLVMVALVATIVLRGNTL